MALMWGMGATFAVTVTVEPGGGAWSDVVRNSTDPASGAAVSVNTLRGSSRQPSAMTASPSRLSVRRPRMGGPGLAQRVDSGCVTATVLASRSVNVPAPVTSDVVSESCPVLPEAEPALKVILNSSTRPPNPFASAIVSVSNPLAAYDVFTAGDTPLPPSA